MNKPKWGRYIEQLREQSGLTRRELASMADIDPSYITLVERNGRVPKNYVTARIMQAVTHNQVEQDVGMLMAGFAPINVSLTDMTKAIKQIHKSRGRHANTGTGGESPSVVPQD